LGVNDFSNPCFLGVVDLNRVLVQIDIFYVWAIGLKGKVMEEKVIAPSRDCAIQIYLRR